MIWFPLSVTNGWPSRPARRRTSNPSSSSCRESTGYGERHRLDRDRRSLAQRRDHLRGVDQDHQLGRKAGEELLPKERPSTTLRKVKAGGDLVRPVQHDSRTGRRPRGNEP